jgi:hypothetical protein
MPTPARFVPGLELARVLYAEAVRPLLDEEYPGLPHAAARVGAGSEVLGFDTERSADHDWGPQLDLFLTSRDAARHGPDIRRLLAERLPKHILGRPTHFRVRDDPDDPVGHMEFTDGPVDHRVRVDHVGGWLHARLGLPPGTGEPSVREWLAMPQQRLAETTGGAVFHDGLGELTAARRTLAWYPDQVWRYLLACQWQRLSQEEAFVGRCAETGDEVGSAVVAGRLVRDLMRLCLLLHRRYAPYGKWLGSAFGQLPVAAELSPMLHGAVTAARYPERERSLCDAYETVARAHNAAGLTEPVDPRTRPYHSRPFRVLHAERFVRALTRTLTDPLVRNLPLCGSADQWADSTDVLTRPELLRAQTDALF